MKNINFILVAAVISLLTGCASTPVVLAPVGPNPMGYSGMGSKGQLLVYSAWQGHGEGNNPCYYQHSNYYIYEPSGKLVRHVENIVGHYAQSPRPEVLPAGKYIVQARAKGYGNVWIKVPVVIQAGRTTRVHLDNGWTVPADIPKTELVSIPIGYPVGWRTDWR
ncbi:MAG: hypothetical protein WBN75_11915 [Verrucomicrobiia bacterium]|jgi:hypothetical protein